MHVGAHMAEEAGEYENNKSGPVIWVEAQPGLIRELQSRVSPPSQVIQALVWNKSGVTMPLNVTNNGQSTSLFELGTHRDSYPEIQVTRTEEFKTSRLDEILPVDLYHNFLTLDIQGAEYEALEGLGKSINRFDYILTEINRKQVYKGIKQVKDLDRFLEDEGFRRVATAWTGDAWGDAFYVRVSTHKSTAWNLQLGLRSSMFRLFQLTQLQTFGALLRTVVRVVKGIK